MGLNEILNKILKDMKNQMFTAMLADFKEFLNKYNFTSEYDTDYQQLLLEYFKFNNSFEFDIEMNDIILDKDKSYCKYEFTKGTKEGEICRKITVGYPNVNYCCNCLMKVRLRKKLKAEGVDLAALDAHINRSKKITKHSRYNDTANQLSYSPVDADDLTSIIYETEACEDEVKKEDVTISFLEDDNCVIRTKGISGHMRGKYNPDINKIEILCRKNFLGIIEPLKPNEIAKICKYEDFVI